MREKRLVLEIACRHGKWTAHGQCSERVRHIIDPDHPLHKTHGTRDQVLITTVQDLLDTSGIIVEVTV